MVSVLLSFFHRREWKKGISSSRKQALGDRFAPLAMAIRKVAVHDFPFGASPR